MKDSGIERKIDELGRIVIPIDIREKLDIKAKDKLEFKIKNDKIIIIKSN